MRWPFGARGDAQRERQESEADAEDARIRLRVLAEELARSIDRLERAIGRMEGEQ